MTGVELARQKAAELYQQAIHRGLDPWQPYEFVRAEAQRLGLDVEATAPGAAVLRGARATYIPPDQLIIHERQGSSFDQAFLVAHELGHVVLGDGHEDDVILEIDAARPAEPSPVGVDRVVDYGRRQRREIQMDLFAREFLLPRLVVKELHVSGGWSASDIASRLGAPFNVVAQQLLDALLLPVVSLRPGNVVVHPLNPQQQAAAHYRGPAYLLEASPGTGKTQTLIARVESLLSDGVDPRRILLLTFSNKAAGEIAERMSRTRADAAAAMWMGTFHGFGLDLIRRFYSQLGFSKDPGMMDRTDAVALLEKEFPRLGLVHHRNLYDPAQIIADVLAVISRAKDEVVDAHRYAELAHAMLGRSHDDESRIAAERALEVVRVYQAYEILKRQANRVDYGDLVALPVHLLESDDGVRSHLRSLYDHVLVDEYQDVNRASIRLLVALHGESQQLWAVGDAKQSIYRFRGASSFNMLRFGAVDFPGGQRNRLLINYRSVEEVVDTYSAFAAEMKAGGDNSVLTAHRGAGGQHPEFRMVDRPEQQTVALADAIEECRRAGYSYRDQVVLCTGNDKLAALAPELERLQIPVLSLGSLFERPAVRGLLAFLSLLTDRRAMGLVRVAGWTEFSMSLEDVAAVLAHLRDSQENSGSDTWWHCPEVIPGLSFSGQATVLQLSAALHGFDQIAAPWTVLATLLLDRSRIAARLADSTAIAERTEAMGLWQVMNFVRVQPHGEGLPIVRLLDHVRRLLSLGDDRDLRQLPSSAQGMDAVRLMTIHGAKGLEFPVVHVPGLNADTLPRVGPPPPCLPPEGMVQGASGTPREILRSAEFEEHECLFYVALSRARDRLFLYAPSQKGGKQARPSPFIARLRLPASQQHTVVPERQLPSNPAAENVSLMFDGGLRFTEAQLAVYERCPRRFFYTYLLQIGGKRRETLFTRMHEAVRSVIEGVTGDLATVSYDEIAKRLETAFDVQELLDQDGAFRLRDLALPLLRYFLALSEGHVYEPAKDIHLEFGLNEVIVRPDQIVVSPGGQRIVRRVRTGHYSSTDKDSIATGAFFLAVQQDYPDAVAELVYLSDGRAHPLEMSPLVRGRRQMKLGEILEDIRRGCFPARPSQRSCPSCPAFFVCGALPLGHLSKKFS
jgi:superfamily I DNA/RNA helicase